MKIKKSELDLAKPLAPIATVFKINLEYKKKSELLTP